jgi:hypothetical protein
MTRSRFDLEVVADDGVCYFVTIRVTKCVYYREAWRVDDWQVITCTVAGEHGEVDVDEIDGLLGAINDATETIPGWDTREHA